MFSNRCLQCAIALLFGMTLATTAFGYIDGGTGSLLLQAAISGILGLVFVSRSFLKSIPERIRRSPRPAEETEPERRAA